jgi:hypothetical protein
VLPIVSKTTEFKKMFLYKNVLLDEDDRRFCLSASEYLLVFCCLTVSGALMMFRGYVVGKKWHPMHALTLRRHVIRNCPSCQKAIRSYICCNTSGGSDS